MTILGCRCNHHNVSMLWRALNQCRQALPFADSVGTLCSAGWRGTRPPILALRKEFSNLTSSIESDLSNVSASISKSNIKASSSDPIRLYIPDEPSKLDVKSTESKLSNGRVMLIDGTAIIYRAYFKLLSKLSHGYLEHADGNGDWVLTICTALSNLVDILEYIPSHVAVVFDHDGLTFRHSKYPAYKANRAPTPDTVVQGRTYFKAAIKAMSIKVIEVPGFEADDVIGTLAANSVADGYKVRVASPDKDFYQILSPSLRLLQISPRGPRMISFGIEDFANKFGSISPIQYIDMLALMGDSSDNIPGVEGIGSVNALKLITKFGTLENLLQCVDQVEEEKIRKALLANSDDACLSKYLDKGDKYISLLRAIGAYAEGFSAEPLIRRTLYLWNKL